MQFGFTLKPEHPIERHLALTRRAEAAGFGSGQALRREFQLALRTAPTAYRRAFQPQPPRG